MDENKPIVISEDDKKKCLQSAIYFLTQKQPFYGSLLQELTIKYSDLLPAIAGITYNAKLQQYEVYINPQMFCSLTNEQRIATFNHEVLHFTNKHLFRLPFLNVPEEERKLYNIAGDMAINQYIQDLPKGCVDVKDWKLDDGSLFPVKQNMETYYGLIKNEQEKQEKNKKTKGNVKENLDKFKDFDQHMWDSLDEETKKQMLDEAKKVLKRTVEKTSFSHSTIPESVKDLLQEIEQISTNINYKQILRNTIKKTVSSIDRMNTWKKPNKRYGNYSPGTKTGDLPNLSIFIDTSGSISIKELNEFLTIMSSFLKAGTRNCYLGLWHTNLYYKKKYRLNTELSKDNIESGGTDVNSVLEDIIKTKPNLSIIFTDGYFKEPKVDTSNEVLFIISKGGNKNINFSKKYKVIYLDNLK